MPIPKKIIEEIEMLNEKENQKVLDKIKQKYMASTEVIVLGENHDWWNNVEDDIYNE